MMKLLVALLFLPNLALSQDNADGICDDTYADFLECTVQSGRCGSCDISDPGLLPGDKCDEFAVWSATNDGCCDNDVCGDRLGDFEECKNCADGSASPGPTPTEPPISPAPTQRPTGPTPTQPPTGPAPSPTQPPTGPAPTQPPTGPIPTQTPSGPTVTQSPTGPAPTQPPTDPVPTPTQPPTGPAPTQPPTGPAPTQTPSGLTVTQSPTGPVPTLPPTGPIPTLPPATSSGPTAFTIGYMGVALAVLLIGA